MYIDTDQHKHIFNSQVVRKEVANSGKNQYLVFSKYCIVNTRDQWKISMQAAV